MRRLLVRVVELKVEIGQGTPEILIFAVSFKVLDDSRSIRSKFGLSHLLKNSDDAHASIVFPHPAISGQNWSKLRT